MNFRGSPGRLIPIERPGEPRRGRYQGDSVGRLARALIRTEATPEGALHMPNAATLADLCEWREIVFTSREAAERAKRAHVAFHRRKHLEGLVIIAINRKACRVGWSGLTEREREIMSAYAAGADLW